MYCFAMFRAFSLLFDSGSNCFLIANTSFNAKTVFSTLPVRRFHLYQPLSTLSGSWNRQPQNLVYIYTWCIGSVGIALTSGCTTEKNSKRYHTPEQIKTKNKPVGWGFLDEITIIEFFFSSFVCLVLVYPSLSGS